MERDGIMDSRRDAVVLGEEWRGMKRTQACVGLDGREGRVTWRRRVQWMRKRNKRKEEEEEEKAT